LLSCNSNKQYVIKLRNKRDMCDFSERWYTDKHEWITIDEKIGTIGISDYAQNALGDVVYAQLPDVGSTIKKDGIDMKFSYLARLNVRKTSKNKKI